MRRFLTCTFFFLIQFSGIAQEKIEKNPEETLKVMWKKMRDRYAVFEERLDGNETWEKSYKEHIPKLSDTINSEELFDVLCSTLKTFQEESHVVLYAKIDKKVRYCYHVENPEFPLNDTVMRMATAKTLEKNGFSEVDRSQKKAYSVSTSSHYGYVNFDFDYLGRLSANRIMKNFEDKDGVIIDLRHDGGGNEASVYRIVNRFADKKRIGGVTKTRKKGTNQYKTDTMRIKPEGSYQFTKKVIVLISDGVYSAGERIAMELKELPHVTLLGTKTHGTLSERWEYRLPNGWWVYYPSQVVYKAKGELIETVGVKPEINFENKEQDWKNGYDETIEKAIELLQNNK